MSDLPNATELVHRGKAASRVGRLEEARDYLRRAVELAPDDAEAWMALAAVEQDPLQKIACFERVLELDPGNVEAQLGLEMLYCANHPSVETMLRCNRCGKPICTRCAVQTPVGYRCRECVGQQQAVFYTGNALDYLIGGAIALVLGGVAAYLMTLLRFWFFGLILGPTVGIAIAEVVRFAVRRRRSRYLWAAVGGGIVVGALPSLLFALANLWALVTLGLFLVLAVGAATARLR
jgi:tetratricopeptide (TPR) repeat protein